VEDDWLPVLYSVLDIGDDSGRGLFGQALRFFHRDDGSSVQRRGANLVDYATWTRFVFSLSSPWRGASWTHRLLSSKGQQAVSPKHPQLTIDGMNFAMMARGLAESLRGPLRAPARIAADHGARAGFACPAYTDAQQRIVPPHRDGSFVWLTGWARSITPSP